MTKYSSIRQVLHYFVESYFSNEITKNSIPQITKII